MSAQPSSKPLAVQVLFAREQRGLFRLAHALTGSRSSAALCVRVARASLPRMAAAPALPQQLTELVARTALELARDAPQPRAPLPANEPGDLEALTHALEIVQERLRVTQRALTALRNVFPEAL